MVEPKKEEYVKLPLRRLKEIAHYYEFPLAVYLLPDGQLKDKKTRKVAYRKAYETLGRIKEILEEVD